MKKLIFILGLGLIIGMANINNTEAQVHVSINIDIQPAWGPSGYNYVEFYYIPEINVYYDVVSQMYYYNNRGRWISSIFLPVAYSYYDFYSLYKVVLNGIHRPWIYNRRHVSLYSGYRYNYSQMPIFYMTESHYHRARSNYHGWVEPRYMPRNNGRPNSHNYSMNTRNGRINEGRSTVSDNRRENVSSRSSRNEATMNSRINNNNNNRGNAAINNRSSNNNNRSNTEINNRSNNNNRGNPAINGRSSNNNNRNTPAVNSRSSNNNNRGNSVISNRNGSRNNDSSVRGNSSNEKKDSPAVSSRNSSRNKDTSVRSSSRSTEKNSSRPSKERSSARTENGRSGRR